MNIENYGIYIVYALLYLVIATIMKYMLNLKTVEHYKADEEISKGNLAVGLRRSGAQFGLAIAMIGVFSGSSTADFMKDLLVTSGYGFLAMGFMLTSLLVTDRLILSKIDNTAALKDGNVAVGFIEFGILVMTGILAYASIKGDSGGVLSSIVYFVAGQITLVLLVLIYEHLLAKNYNPVENILKGNLSAGIYMAGKVIAYGFILQSAIVGDSPYKNITDAALTYIEAAVAGMLILYIFEILIDWLIITSTDVKKIIQDDQIVAAVQLSLGKVGMALILGMAIL
jgi:uncharacterized membrane protein YjfL (UPF0719 family)